MKAILNNPVPIGAAAVVALSLILAPVTISFAAEQASQVSIAGNGYTIVRGATVTAVTERYIQANSAWNSAGMPWIVDTISATKFFNADGERISQSDIRVGDTVNFSGQLDAAAKKPTVVARVVKDLSITQAAAADESAEDVGIPNTGAPAEMEAAEVSVLKQLVDWLRGTRGLLSLG